MGKRLPPEVRSFLVEVGAAALIGAAAALFVPPAAFSRIDDALVTFLALVTGAALPGIALTAAASRPVAASAGEARALGGSLEGQIRFWFSYLLTGGAATLWVIVGKAADWSLPTPRPDFVPAFVPPGGAWLVLAAVSSTVFATLRVWHIRGAVIDLVRLGTKSAVETARANRQSEDQAIAAQIKQLPGEPGRGALASPRKRR